MRPRLLGLHISYWPLEVLFFRLPKGGFHNLYANFSLVNCPISGGVFLHKSSSDLDYKRLTNYSVGLISVFGQGRLARK